VKRSVSDRAGLALVLAALTAAAVIFLAACQPRPLPEAGSDAARTYVERCGQCHPVYDPHSMTGAMWQTQVELMDTKIALVGVGGFCEATQPALCLTARLPWKNLDNDRSSHFLYDECADAGSALLLIARNLGYR
jgi:hypothetical protein